MGQVGRGSGTIGGLWRETRRERRDRSNGTEASPTVVERGPDDWT